MEILYASEIVKSSMKQCGKYHVIQQIYKQIHSDMSESYCINMVKNLDKSQTKCNHNAELALQFYTLNLDIT